MGRSWRQVGGSWHKFKALSKKISKSKNSRRHGSSGGVLNTKNKQTNKTNKKERKDIFPSNRSLHLFFLMFNSFAIHPHRR
jgi:hypothetical protein